MIGPQKVSILEGVVIDFRGRLTPTLRGHGSPMHTFCRRFVDYDPLSLLQSKTELRILAKRVKLGCKDIFAERDILECFTHVQRGRSGGTKNPFRSHELTPVWLSRAPVEVTPGWYQEHPTGIEPGAQLRISSASQSAGDGANSQLATDICAVKQSTKSRVMKK